MATPLKDRIRNAALADSGLLALLGTVSPASLRWYDMQLVQGSATPAMVVQVISNPQMYVTTGRLAASFARVQFTLWSQATTGGSAVLGQLDTAFKAFLNTFNFTPQGIQGQNPNQIAGRRDGFYAETQPPKFWLQYDVMIYFDDTLD